MNRPVNSFPFQFAHCIVGFMVVVALTACGSKGNADSDNAAVAESKPGTVPVADVGADSDSPSTSTHPLCGNATYSEVSKVTGGRFDKIDVIDKPDLDYVECIFLDSRDLYAGLTIRFVPTAKLVATDSQWKTAAAYFAEWSRGGESVTGVGERAAWIELPAGLLVLVGDHALQFSASKSDLSDPAVRARFETLARAVVARIP